MTDGGHAAPWIMRDYFAEVLPREIERPTSEGTSIRIDETVKGVRVRGKMWIGKGRRGKGGKA